MWLDDRPQPVGHARQRSVLAVLAAEANRVVPVDSLIDRVWGERPPNTARSVLRVYLTHLRRALATSRATVTRHGSGYVLATELDTVDLHRFRWLFASARGQEDPQRALTVVEEALALWRGEPLAELDTAWAQAVRERLRRERAAAETDRIDWALACGRHRQVLPELTARAEAEPLDERVTGQVMLALYRAGRQADALAHYQRTRQHLVEELGIDPGPALHQLHQRILTSDPTLSPTNTTTTTVGAPSLMVPRQLPAPPRRFTGRTDHLTVLNAALDRRGTGVIFAIGGAGGIGKTWLVLAWAHRHLDRFPDGQLFVDLRGFSPDGTPTDPAVAVRGFLDALGVPPDRIPVDPQAQAALYRSLVAEKRMLIVLDNAATTEQVMPLLPGGTTCTVLVTSRHRLHGLTARHGAHPLPLGVLTDAESHALLVAILGADRIADDAHFTAELIALCAGFPLALGLVAARAQPDLPLAEAVSELRESGLDALDADDPTASLPAVLSWSLRHLTDTQRTAFALLGIAPGPDIGLPAATSLTGLPDREARIVLRALADVSLLDHTSGGRYAMHDLVRAYATTIAHDLPEPVRGAALDRVVDFYLHTTYAADRLLFPQLHQIRLDPPTSGGHSQPLADRSAAFAWLDAEHRHLLAAQHVAATEHRHHIVWQLASALTTFHLRRGHRHDNLTVWRTALNATAHLPDPNALVLSHRRLGRAYADMGRHEEADRHLVQALALAEHHDDPSQQAQAHGELSWALYVRANGQQALEHAKSALEIHNALDQQAWKAHALNMVAWLSAHLGEYDTARKHCQTALALHRSQHDLFGEANIQDVSGWIDHQTGQHNQAVDHYQQALTLFHRLGHTTAATDVLEHLGHPYSALGQHDEALTVWREALELYRQQGREADAERVQRQLADLHNTR
nr:BTAD domain-containing putative transcriptional regulator [Saccharothrix saharensis]